jgi:tRNA-2-methylthio-N6-dimethylallyladenosine synthase
MIVGFPGETEEDFEQTLSLVREVGFVALFGFKYSPRPFTPALQLKDDISEEEKGRRLAALFDVVDTQKAAHLAALVGQEVVVLVDGKGKTGDPSGRSEQNEIVHLTPDASGAVAAEGELWRVRITDAFKNSLRGVGLGRIHGAPPRPEAARSVHPKTGGRRVLPMLGGTHGTA